VILEAFKPGEEPPSRQRLVTGGDAIASSGVNVGRDSGGVVIQGGSDDGSAAVSEGGLTTGTGGLY
jgi:penicillin-binding protein 1A